MIRNIKVIVEATQQGPFVFNNVDVYYLSDVKSLVRGLGINFDEDAVFKEARSKATYTADDAIMPTNIPWRGDVTNDLSFLITTPLKKIKSGALRSELYEKIKEYNCQNDIKEFFGDIYTRVSSKALEEFLKDYETSDEDSALDALSEWCSSNLCETKAELVVDYIRTHYNITIKDVLTNSDVDMYSSKKEDSTTGSYDNCLSEFDF